MNTPSSSSRRLFEVGAFEARELTEDDLVALQDFFVANPEYFLAFNGMPPRPDEARQEFEDRPPPEIPFSRAYTIGFLASSGPFVAMASVLSGFVAMQVWHIGFFLLATSLHGTGTAMALYSGLEQWMKEEGALWLRLGVVAGNSKAERFWEKAGYTEVKRRAGMQLGNLTHTVRVLVKPMGSAGLEEYFRLIVRDRPPRGGRAASGPSARRPLTGRQH